MPARSTWRGSLAIASLSIPVRAFNSIDRSPDIELHQYHTSCGGPIKQSRYCPKHGTVETSEICLGYEYSAEQVLLFSADELASISPNDSKEIDITCFVKGDVIPTVYLSGKHLYVVPDGTAAQRPFAAILKSLESTGKIGVCKMVMYQREQVVIVRPSGRLLCMSVLEYADRVRCAADYESELEDVELIDEELHLARQLVDVLTIADLSLESICDPRTAKLQALIESKIQKALGQQSMANELSRTSGYESQGVTDSQPQSALAASLRATLRTLPPHARQTLSTDVNSHLPTESRQTG